MKIAVLHSSFEQLGGAEKVALHIASHLNADIITTNFDKESINKFGFSKVKIKSIGKTPKDWPKKHFETLKLFKKKKFDDYELIIITSEWALSATKGNTPSIFYVNSIPREDLDFEDEYLTQNMTKADKEKFQKKANQIKNILKKYIFKTNIVICNSNHTQRELMSNVKRDSILVYPPVDTDKFYFNKYGDFWLSVNRIDYYKRIGLQLETFSMLPDEKLFIVGDHDSSNKKYLEYLRSKKPKNVQFLGRKDGDELLELYSSCKGFLTTAKDEYFGLTAIEAMASGKPVIAINEGGYRETVNNSVGVLTEANKYDLSQAVKKISNNPKKYKEECLKRSKEFSLESFNKKMDRIVNGIL